MKLRIGIVFLLLLLGTLLTACTSNPSGSYGPGPSSYPSTYGGGGGGGCH